MKKSIKKSFILSCIMALALPSVSSFAQVTDISRISGSNRYETALKISTTHFKDPTDVQFVIIASGETYPDALIGGSLAAQEECPMLLTGKNSVPKNLISELKRLDPEQIFVLGGPVAVSDSVFNTIKNQTGIPIERVYGKNRIETSEEVNSLRAYLADMSEKDFDNLDPSFFGCVDAYKFPDALAAAPYYGLMSSDNGVGFLSLENSPVYEKDGMYGEAIGGIQVIRDGSNSMVITKGSNRYETAVKVAENYKKELNHTPDTVVLTSGENFPDALASSSLSGKFLAPLLLTGRDHLSPYVKDYIAKNNIKKVIIIGGNVAVSDNVIAELKAIK